MYITHICFHTGLPDSLAQENEETNQLLIENVLEASKFYEKHPVNSKDLKNIYHLATGQGDYKKYPTWSFAYWK